MSTQQGGQPLITVVTAVRNGADGIRQTIDSVLAQTYPDIQYVVVDAASTDATAEIVAGYGDRIDTFVSEPDRGLYDGLDKGFARARGDILCYINAGDFYLPHAFAVVAEIFAAHADVDWLVGGSLVANSRYELTETRLPFRFRRDLIRKGSYGTGLPFILQEASFWRAPLMTTVDRERWRSFRLAGDAFLWWSFATRAEPAVVASPLAVFTRHSGQLSEDGEGYLREMASFSEQRGAGTRLRELVDRALWGLLPHHRARFADTGIRFDFKAGAWRRG